MKTREPYMEDDVTYKTHFSLDQNSLKIPLTTDAPIQAPGAVNTPKFSSRKSSMEPYYKTSSRRNTITSSRSSYVMMSDVFDYHYLDQIDAEDYENAIVTDSDTDYDEEEDGDFQVRHHRKSRTWSDECSSDSELEDYKVHFLMFKVTSRAQYSVPPRSSSLTASDQYEDVPMKGADYSLIPTVNHPRFSSPLFHGPSCPIDFLDDPLEKVLSTYSLQCNNPLNIIGKHEREVTEVSKAPLANARNVSDSYDGAAVKNGIVSDVYDTERIEYLF
ncbi:predicted protein [Clavispora lusitaniae ATCC 42720]|uniref:Uncharacterized protein n=1 Tax=Clavispora lusitaniae (strain ATCC 42720) TaxID=306902 RepID=C4Y421_CLAL4|nr:uncharacterized protein CLUG_02393 [Clavispora lusitaniae ATCC 42720]EEQ38267.1 predicted protein [Clavispora lusitaniae ATCC 42720]KAF5211476.1 hypothetical protein E0198_002790 [Clavispora lusitaniae]